MTLPLLGAITQVGEVLISLGDTSTADEFVAARHMFENPGLEVVVFGAFNRGKSTLINAILGENILPAKLIPTTGHVTRISYGEARAVRVLLRDGKYETCPFDELDQFSLVADKHVRDDIELIVVSCPSPILKRGLAIVDTPGIQDSEAQTRRAERAVAHSHLILLVLDAQQPMAQWEKTQALRFVENCGKPLILIVNKLNLIEPSERPAVMRRIDQWSRRHLPVEIRELGRSYLEVDALGGLRDALNIGPKPCDDFPSLRGLFTGINPVQIQELRSRGNCGYMSSEVARVRTTNDRLLWQLRDTAVEVERRRAARVQLLTGLTRQFKSMAEAVEESVILFASQRLSRLEEEAARPTTIGAPKEAQSGESFEDALSAVETEANRRATDLERGMLVKPMPFTVAEELALRVRAQSNEEIGQPCTITISVSDPVVLSELRHHALDVLRSQFRARMLVTHQDLDRELQEQRSLPPVAADELRLRQSLERALKRLEMEIKLMARVAQVARRAYDLYRAGVGNSVDENWAQAEDEIGGEHDSATD